ncbi:MAG: NrsF family protein [Pseudomonadota bacterium]
MNTRQLITALVIDYRVSPAPAPALVRWMIPACALSTVALLATAGLRQDLALVAATPRVLFKWLFAGALILASIGALLRLARPGVNLGKWSTASCAVVLTLAPGVAAELLLPRGQWIAQARGLNATWCLRMIPLLAGAVGAALYALHCTDDSPLFVATWYSLAILAMTGAGAIAGARWLR